MLNNKFVKITGSILILILVFLGGWFAHSAFDNQKKSEAGNVATSYLELLLANRSSEAYDKVAPSIKKSLTRDQLKETTAQVASPTAKITQHTTVKIADRYVTYVTVDGLPKTESGETSGIFTIVVTKEDGKLGVESSVVQ